MPSYVKAPLAAALLAVAGCALPDQTAVPTAGVAVPAAWSAAASPEPSPSVGTYWTTLRDPLLDRFVAKALEANRDLDRAAARVRQARAGVRASRAGYLPRLDAAAGVQRDIGDLSDDKLQFSVGVDAQWEIDLFGQISNDVAAAHADLAAAGYGLADLQRLIAGEVARSTVLARALATQLAIGRDTLRIQDENLQIAQWRLQAGLVSSLDVEQARAQRAQTAATIPALERDLAQTANGISTLIGEAPGEVRRLITAEAAPIPVPPAQFGYAAPAEILRARPDVRQAEATLVASSARIDVVRAQLLPLIRLTGNIGSSSLGLSGLFDLVSGGVFAGVSQMIFDGGRTRAQIESARATAADALAAWEQVILRTLEDVESADAAFVAARERVVLLAEALDAANGAALLARSQYQAGLIDFQTLLTAENQLLTARNTLAASEADRATAFVSLAQALGGGWDAASDATINPSTNPRPAP